VFRRRQGEARGKFRDETLTDDVIEGFERLRLQVVRG
jgi:hypothetical protein